MIRLLSVNTGVNSNFCIFLHFSQINEYGNRKLRYLVVGAVDLNAIPEEKRHLEIGIERNPVPLVDFLPDLNKNNRRK